MVNPVHQGAVPPHTDKEEVATLGLSPQTLFGDPTVATTARRHAIPPCMGGLVGIDSLALQTPKVYLLLLFLAPIVGTMQRLFPGPLGSALSPFVCQGLHKFSWGGVNDHLFIPDRESITEQRSHPTLL